MKVTSTLMTLAEYCDQIASKAIVVNRDYQRSPKRWPVAARSFLIDTVLQGYPIPKVVLAQQTDLISRKTIKEIVDGQQRSAALSEYFNDDFRITGDSPYTGRAFTELEPEQQQAFLSYPIGADIFTGADPADIRQMFRRMNSYTVPLNPQEQRYATHQGPFKWFIFEQSGLYANSLKQIGVFGERQISAMQDGLLLTELCDAMVNGIRTASNRHLDRFYADRDETFPEVDALTLGLRTAFDFILQMPDIHGSALMKPFQFFTLALAAAHSSLDLRVLRDVYQFPQNFKPDPSSAASFLGALAAAVEVANEAIVGPEEFLFASSRATNTLRNRTVRFTYFCRAIDGSLTS